MTHFSGVFERRRTSCELSMPCYDEINFRYVLVYLLLCYRLCAATLVSNLYISAYVKLLTMSVLLALSAEFHLPILYFIVCSCDAMRVHLDNFIFPVVSLIPGDKY